MTKGDGSIRPDNALVSGPTRLRSALLAYRMQAAVRSGEALSPTITIAPVRKSAVVRVAPTLAFGISTEGVDGWWPKSNCMGGSPFKRFLIEPFKGGRWMRGRIRSQHWPRARPWCIIGSRGQLHCRRSGNHAHRGRRRRPASRLAYVRRGSRETIEPSVLSAQPRDHPFQAADEPLPAVARALVVGLLFGPEARLLHAHEDAALRRRQRPSNDGLRSPAASSPEAFQL
jgi:hypothetical protein